MENTKECLLNIYASLILIVPCHWIKVFITASVVKDNGKGQVTR